MARLDDENEIMSNNNNNNYEVNSSDDEEIDEDEAFNSDDELMYGEFFLSNNNNKRKRKKKNDGDKKMKAKRSLNSSSDESDGSDGSNDDSESDENDWAGGGGSDEDSNEGEEDDGGAYMLDLLNNLDKQVPTKSDKKKQQHENKGEGGKISYTNQLSEAAVHLKESEYQSGVLSAMNAEEGGGGGDGKNKLTLDSLMGGISDTAGFATVQKSMRALSSGLIVDKDGEGGQQQKKKLTTTAAPVSRVISDRASRKVHYEATSEDVTQWKDAIHEQRDAETLDFRTNKGGATTNRITRDVLVDKFEATTDFEKEIQVALEFVN